MTGTIWVCRACGKSAADRYKLRDVSCFVNAVECDPSTVVRDRNGGVAYATAVER